MKMKYLIVLGLVIAFVSCGTQNAAKTKVNEEKMRSFATVDSIKIESNWARPLNATEIQNTGLLPIGSSAANISLIGNTNYFKIIGDSLSVYLPYYGRRQMVGPNNPDDVGIVFEGIPSEFTQSYNQRKNRYEYYFEFNNGTENFQTRVNIYSNLRTDIQVNSTYRTFISYGGLVIETPALDHVEDNESIN